MSQQNQRTLSAACFAAAILSAPLAAQHVVQNELGWQTGSYYGSALAPAGDMNRDGTPDWIVGVPKYSWGGQTDAGIALVVSGADGSWIQTVRGTRSGMRLGWSVAGVGDLDGDGYPDYAAGAPRDTRGGGSNAGYVTVRSGRDNSELWSHTGEPGSSFGISICSLGDINGDGVNEVAVGAPENTASSPFGSVTIYSGRGGAQVYRRVGGSQERFGYSVANGGDLDGDGKDDLIVGSPHANGGASLAGMVSTFTTRYRGRIDIITIYLGRLFGGFDYSRFGAAVAGAGDVDGDGTADVIVGGPGPNAIRGVVAVISGRTGAAIRIHQRLPDFGFAVGGAGDVDGDGYDDYAAGHPLDTQGGPESGRSFVYSGRTGGVLLELGGILGEKCGYAVAGVGDLDGDGLDEVAIGLPKSNRAGLLHAGQVTVLGYDLAGTASTFGSGCPGAAGPVTLSAGGTLQVGGHLDLTITGAMPGASGLLFLGTSSTSWGGTSLPLELSFLGMPGCQLLVAPLVSVPFTTSSGKVVLRWGLPAQAAITRARLFAQSFTTDTVNAAGLVVTNGVDVLIGN